ncbi:GTP cyclohydrolase I-domain-containing protein [Haematococcus lacustris]
MAVAGNSPASSRLSLTQGCEAAAGGCLRSNQVFLTALPFHSLCEHHMLPFYGSAHVLYTMHPSPAHPSLPNPSPSSPSPSSPSAQPLATAPLLLYQDGCITGATADTPPSPRQQHCNGSCGGDEEVGLSPEMALLPAQHSTQGAFTGVSAAQQQAEVALQASPPCHEQLSLAPCGPSTPAALEVLLAPAPVAGMLQHLLQALTQRLQVQERITHQLADTAWQLLGPEVVESVVVVVDAAHMCMVARGVENHAGHTTSVAARGKALQDSQLRRVAISAARAGFTALRPTTV